MVKLLLVVVLVSVLAAETVGRQPHFAGERERDTIFRCAIAEPNAPCNDRALGHSLWSCSEQRPGGLVASLNSRGRLRAVCTK